MEFNFKLFSNKFTGSNGVKLGKVTGGFGDLTLFKAIYQGLPRTVLGIYRVLTPNCFLKALNHASLCKKIKFGILAIFTYQGPPDI